MISLFGYSIHALYPLVLLGAPLGAAFLVYVYRSLGDSRKTVISSLFLLRDLPRASPGKSKFIPPPQFWIELLCFIALALAATGIIATREGEHIAIVIDTSLSMGASQIDGSTRLDQAKKVALSHLDQSPLYNRFTVFEARGTAHKRTPPEVNASEAADAISALSYSVEQDRLAGTIESLYSSGDYDGVWLYTDHLVTKSNSDSNSAQPALRITSLPSSQERSNSANIWISDIVETSTPEGSSLTIVVEGSSSTPIPATVTTSCYADSLTQPIGQPIARQTTVHSGTQTKVTIELLPQGWGFCKAIILPNSTTLYDSITDDSNGWIIHSSSQEKVPLLSPLTPSQLGLDTLKTPTIVSYQSLAASELQNKPTIFHRVELPTSAPPPSFAILPPAGALPWGGSISANEVKNCEVTRWSTSHPILQYLNVATLVLPSARIITCPDTSSGILFTREGAIACAGESPSGRYVILGFEVFPFDGARSPSTSILVLNIFKWLLQDLALDNRPKTPGYQMIPAGAVSALQVGGNRTITEFDESRRILLQGTSLFQFKDQKGTPISLASSLFSSTYESDVRSENPLTINLSSEKNREKKSTSSDLWYYFALAALLVLGWDLTRKLIGKSRWEAP